MLWGFACKRNYVFVSEHGRVSVRKLGAYEVATKWLFPPFKSLYLRKERIKSSSKLLISLPFTQYNIWVSLGYQHTSLEYRTYKPTHTPIVVQWGREGWMDPAPGFGSLKADRNKFIVSFLYSMIPFLLVMTSCDVKDVIWPMHHLGSAILDFIIALFIVEK